MRVIAARGIHARFDAGCGHLPGLVIDGVPVLWSAPWRDDPGMQADGTIPMVERRLGGSFACAPFGRDDVDGGPPHGAVANAPWQVTRHGPSSLTARCGFVRGAIETRLAVRDGHPVLYRIDTLDLTAPYTFALHPMLDVAGGARLSGPVRTALTFAAESPVFDPGAREAGWGPFADYPDRTCEEFVTVIHAPGLVWTAVARAGHGDTILFLKQAGQLPMTNLWMSNGARTGVPWHGARGILGVEDAICAGAEGFAAALAGRGRVADEGVLTHLPPGRHVIPTAILRMTGLHRVTGLTVAADGLTVTTPEGSQDVPFESGHFA
ncbi:hypothetical protein [Jannaschia pohangensis]|uniref:Aldose 1-epimerase n=1 Tax=Jannaschia pohangensis TaxID=390807 RepID=A0A1I3HZ44_9RHOB|nr:hypothetical protein [Jannaschia pohangensis]SFI40847.1 hypothetical protein SAMN04488095_0752 [Jannaschia pohangensis]